MDCKESSTRVYVLIKMFFFYFFTQKKTTNKANWSEVNRSGLHSLKESLNLEDNSIIV